MRPAHIRILRSAGNKLQFLAQTLEDKDEADQMWKIALQIDKVIVNN